MAACPTLGCFLPQTEFLEDEYVVFEPLVPGTGAGTLKIFSYYL